MSNIYVQCHLQYENRHRISWVKSKLARVTEVIEDTKTNIFWKIMKTYGKETSDCIFGCKL